MVIISTLKGIISPVDSMVSGTTLKRETRLMTQNIATIYTIHKKNISMDIGRKKKIPTKVALKDNSDEVLIKVKQNYQFQEGVQKMKELVADKLMECYHGEELVIIDAIQRLGLGFYFQDEISAALRKTCEIFRTKEGGHDLYEAALCFRLLRQHGYNVPAASFRKFMDKDGNFKQELGKDSKGLMSLFEASHLRFPEDHILDYAGEFCWHLLSNFKNDDSSEASIIRNTLNHPYHKSLPRFMASDFLQNYELSMKLLHGHNSERKWMAEVRDLAEIDINRNQISIKHEINEFCRWWEELQLPKELKLARNEPVKWHMWSLACLPDPNMAELRLELTKEISFIYIIDDIFDVYGKLEELTLFTESVNKWEYASFDRLPDYMIICLKALFDTTSEISHKVNGKYGLNPINYLQIAWAEYCDASLVQAKWVALGYMPTTQEYMKSAIISTGSYVAHIHMFFLLGEALEEQQCRSLLSNHTDISCLAATILRLWDDLGSSKDEHQIHDGSVIDCHINEHEGSSYESARQYVFAMISDSWNHLNKILASSPFSANYKAAVANVARIIPLMYKYDDNHHLPTLEKHMKSLVHSANE